MLIMPQNIDLSIVAPASKSESLRAMLIALLNKKETILTNLSNSSDAKALLNILKNYKQVEISGNTLTVRSADLPTECEFPCGESAFLARAFAGISPFYFNSAKITSQGSLSHRNVSDIFEFCKLNRIAFEGKAPHLPMRINGKYMQNMILVNSDSSSQILSGVLIGNAFADTPLCIASERPASKGYVELTLSMLKNLGVSYNYFENQYTITNNLTNKSSEIDISGDWSGAAFMLVAASIAGKVKLKGLKKNSMQPDEIILKFLKQLNININENNDIADGYTVTCEKSKIRAFEFDASGCPDLIPPLVALAANASGSSIIYGANRLINKESNRKLALCSEFSKIGGQVAADGDKLLIKGGEIIGGEVDSHNDHRIAMALSVAGLAAKNAVKINNYQAVAKSYPNFFKDLLNK